MAESKFLYGNYSFYTADSTGLVDYVRRLHCPSHRSPHVGPHDLHMVANHITNFTQPDS